jgi:hypothetical protein
LQLLSRSILLALMSRCTIGDAISSCRYARPLATPMHIADLIFQLKLAGSLLDPSEAQGKLSIRQLN